MADFDRNKPSIARVYDYFLLGKDNFAADRELGDRLIGIAPELPLIIRENREMLTRAVTWSAEQGIDQFIDVGCGMPTEPSTHQTARAVIPEAKVAYIDNDPVVISHLTAIQGQEPLTAVINGDFTDSGAVLAGVEKLIDRSRPACLLLGALVHFFELEAIGGLITPYVSALAPGSHVVLTVGEMPPGPAADRFMEIYSSGPSPIYDHPAEDVLSVLDGLDILPPGIVDTRLWRPGWRDVTDPGPRGVWMNGVMARVPGR